MKQVILLPLQIQDDIFKPETVEYILLEGFRLGGSRMKYEMV